VKSEESAKYTINHTYNPDEYPKYNIENNNTEEDVLDFLRRGVDFEARD
jgi:hypothetical protein